MPALRLGGLATLIAIIVLAGCHDDPGICGDREVQSKHEECDDGNTFDGDDCLSDCTLAVCGDGIVRSSVEECDDAAGNSDTEPGACRLDCRKARCGDGVRDLAEGCDDGNLSDNDACLSTCISATCGDGIVNPAVEECDTGSANSNQPDACRKNCRAARCGDNVIDTAEQCDDFNTSDNDGCLNICLLATCGDGILRTDASPEQCDDGAANSDTVADACRLDCTESSCGDTVIDTGETCDDGNSSDADACLVSCVINVCGDGYVNPLAEQCEDLNSYSDDACISCANASCGDGLVRDGHEECDAGAANGSSPNTCRATCKLPACGDGIIDAGESCDGGGAATVTCDPDCTLPACGDGVTNVAFGETCDDSSPGCSASCTIQAGWVTYVDADATGANNGSSWANAYTTLQDALIAKTQGEIWVAAGTYYPDRGGGVTPGPTATFQLKSNVALYGGFAGTELSRAQRTGGNTTTLAGYVQLENARHIMTATNVTNAVVDRFTVIGGYATDAFGGGAMRIENSSVVIRDCSFMTNVHAPADPAQPAHGGAVSALASNLTIEGCQFDQSTADAGYMGTPQQPAARGGALYISGGTVLLRDSTFTENHTTGPYDAGGGAMFSDGAQLQIVGSTFTRNWITGATASGGALSVSGGSAVIHDSVFFRNLAGPVGESATTPCMGGAIAIGAQSRVDLAGSVLDGNSASCTPAYGGAIYANGTAAVVNVTSSTLVHNINASVDPPFGTHPGQTIYVGNGASAVVANSVLWNNPPSVPQIEVAALGSASVTYSCLVTSGWGVGTQTLTVSPFSEGWSANEQSTLRLSMASSCINAGNNAAVPADAFDLDRDGNSAEPLPLDHAGRPRFVGTVDVGAYEKQ